MCYPKRDYAFRFRCVVQKLCVELFRFGYTMIVCDTHRFAWNTTALFGSISAPNTKQKTGLCVCICEHVLLLFYTRSHFRVSDSTENIPVLHTIHILCSSVLIDIAENNKIIRGFWTIAFDGKALQSIKTIESKWILTMYNEFLLVLFLLHLPNVIVANIEPYTSIKKVDVIMYFSYWKVTFRRRSIWV